MARRANYGFEKRQRELKKQKKKEAKAEKRRLRKEAAALAEADGEEVDLEGNPGSVGDEVTDVDETGVTAEKQHEP